MIFSNDENSIQLEGVICETDHALVCRARLSNDRQALVKFLPKVDFFFEELSRHYACDHSRYLPQLLHNFPPTSVGGIDYLSQSEIERFIDLSWPDIDISEIGALVIEYVEGQPILEKLKTCSREQQIFTLLQIAEALRDLHSQGECHGQLTPDQVLFDPVSNHIKFVDLSYFQGKIPSVLPQLSPEHNPHSQFEVQAASDIYMFALHFFDTIENPSSKLKRLIQQALEFDPTKRPNIEKILDCLSAETNQPAPLLSRRSRIWSPIWIGILGCYGFFSTIAITHYYDNPLLKARTEILEQNTNDTHQAVIALAQVRADANIDDSTAAILAHDIAQIKKNAPNFEVATISQNQFENPLAVFALKQLPSIITWNHVLTLGDWVQLNNQTGYISKIDSFSLEVTFASKTELILFTPSGFRYGLADSRVIIWKRPGNLNTLLAGISDLADFYQINLDPNESHRILNTILNRDFSIPSSSELLFGSFEVSTFTDFLFKLESMFDLNMRGNNLQLANDQSYPLHYTIHFFHFVSEVPASQAYRYVESSIGLPIVLPDSFSNRTIGPLEAFQVSWDEALNLLGYQWEIRDRGRDTEIIVYDRPILETENQNLQVSEL